MHRMAPGGGHHYPSEWIAAFDRGAEGVLYRECPYRPAISSAHPSDRGPRPLQTGRTDRVAYPSLETCLSVTASGGEHGAKAKPCGKPRETGWGQHVRHWHGAAPEVAMPHLFVAEEDGGTAV